jgi:hypothetical protein
MVSKETTNMMTLDTTVERQARQLLGSLGLKEINAIESTPAGVVRMCGRYGDQPTTVEFQETLLSEAAQPENHFERHLVRVEVSAQLAWLARNFDN